jgi:nitrogen fixation protein FixH
MDSKADYDPPRSRKGRAWLWPTIIIVSLTLHTVVMLGVVVIASRDSTFRVDPDYFRRDFNFDQKKAQLEASRKLGWRVHLTGTASQFAIDLRDNNGQPISDATITIRYFHNAAARDVKDLSLSATTDPGIYHGAIALNRTGFYTIDTLIVRGDQRFIDTRDLYITR